MSEKIDSKNAAEMILKSFDTGGTSVAKESLEQVFQKTSSAEFKSIVADIEKRTAGRLQVLYAERDTAGNPIAIYLDDSWRVDTCLFDRYSAIKNKGLANASQEKTVQKWNKVMVASKCDQNGGVTAATQATESLMNFALSHSKEEQNSILRRAIELNRNERGHVDGRFGSHSIPGLIITFGDLDKDGKRDNLSDVKIHYTHNFNYMEVIDLYDP